MSDVRDTPASGGSGPIPARLYWLKRLIVGVILLELSLTGLRYLSLAVAERRVRADIDRIRAAGEPILPADFAEPQIPDEQNAAVDLAKAGRLFKVPKTQEAVWDTLPSGGYQAKDIPTIDAVLAANREPLDLLRTARGKSGVNWGLKMRSPAFTVLLPMLNELKDLTIATAFAARRANEQGRDGEAVEHLRDMLAISRSLETQPFLVSHLVAGGISDVASTTIASVAPQLKVNSAAEGAASEAQVRALIKELLDDRQGARGGWRWCFVGERMMQLDAGLTLAGGGKGFEAYIGQGMLDRSYIWWLKPMLLGGQPRLTAAATADIHAAEAPDLATATQRLAPFSKVAGPPTQMASLMTFRTPALLRVFSNHYRSVLQRRVAAIALAERLYEKKHGRPATRIEELVPEFLPAVPEDPMAGGGAPLPVSSRAKSPTSAPATGMAPRF